VRPGSGRHCGRGRVLLEQPPGKAGRLFKRWFLTLYQMINFKVIIVNNDQKHKTVHFITKYIKLTNLFLSFWPINLFQYINLIQQLLKEKMAKMQLPLLSALNWLWEAEKVRRKRREMASMIAQIAPSLKKPKGANKQDCDVSLYNEK